MGLFSADRLIMAKKKPNKGLIKIGHHENKDKEGVIIVEKSGWNTHKINSMCVRHI
jgi:hypothetical protein